MDELIGDGKLSLVLIKLKRLLECELILEAAHNDNHGANYITRVVVKYDEDLVFFGLETSLEVEGFVIVLNIYRNLEGIFEA